MFQSDSNKIQTAIQTARRRCLAEVQAARRRCRCSCYTPVLPCPFQGLRLGPANAPSDTRKSLACGLSYFWAGSASDFSSVPKQPKKSLARFLPFRVGSPLSAPSNAHRASSEVSGGRLGVPREVLDNWLGFGGTWLLCSQAPKCKRKHPEIRLLIAACLLRSQAPKCKRKHPAIRILIAGCFLCSQAPKSANENTLQ